MKRILTLVALLLACIPAFGAILQNAYTSNTTAQADAHVLALDTNAPPLPANVVTNPWPNSLIVTGALSVASSTYPDSLLLINPTQGIFDAGDIGFDHNKTFININDLTKKTITVSATNGTQFYGPVTGSFNSIGGNGVTNDQPFILIGSSALGLNAGLFVYDLINNSYDEIQPDLNGHIRSTVGFSGPFYGDGSGLTGVLLTGAVNAPLQTNAAAYLDDYLITTNLAFLPKTAGGAFQMIATVSNATLLVTGDSMTAGQGGYLSASEVLGMKLKNLYGDDGGNCTIFPGSVDIGNWGNYPTQLNRWSSLALAGYWFSGSVGVVYAADGTNALQSHQGPIIGSDGFTAGNNFCNVVGISYLTQPLGGNFVLQVSSALNAVTNFSTVSGFSSTTNFVQINEVVPPGANDWRIYLTSLVGTNFFLSANYLGTNAGVQVWAEAAGDQTLSNMLACGTNNLAAMYAAIKPNLVVYHAKDIAEVTSGTQLTNFLYQFLEYEPSNCLNGIVGTPPIQTGSYTDQNYYVKLACQANGWAYLPLWNDFQSWDRNNASGLMFDPTHPNNAGAYAWGEDLFEMFGFSSVPLALNAATLYNTIPQGSIPLTLNVFKNISSGGFLVAGLTNASSTAAVFNPFGIGFYGGGATNYMYSFANELALRTAGQGFIIESGAAGTLLTSTEAGVLTSKNNTLDGPGGNMSIAGAYTGNAIGLTNGSSGLISFTSQTNVEEFNFAITNSISVTTNLAGALITNFCTAANPPFAFTNWLATSAGTFAESVVDLKGIPTWLQNQTNGNITSSGTITVGANVILGSAGIVQFLNRAIIESPNSSTLTFMNGNGVIKAALTASNAVFDAGVATLGNHIPNAVSVGASPFTFTNPTGNPNLRYHILDSAAYSVSLNGVPIVSSFTGPYADSLEVTDVLVLTYLSTAPTLYTNQ